MNKVFIILILSCTGVFAQTPSSISQARTIIKQQKEQLTTALKTSNEQKAQLEFANTTITQTKEQVVVLEGQIQKERDEKLVIQGQRDWWEQSYKVIESKYSNISNKVNIGGFAVAILAGAVAALGVSKITKLAAALSGPYAVAVPVVVFLVGSGAAMFAWQWFFRAT